MKRFMQDLGDLAGLDIVAAGRCTPVRGAASRRDASDGVPAAAAAAALARGALRWLGLAATGDGRCRAGGSADADLAEVPASRLH